MKQRIKYMDVAKGIAIILMVAGHCDNIGKIARFVNLFHMALFAFVSGFFCKANLKNFKDLVVYLKRKIVPLYTFYLKFELLFYLLTNVFFDIGFLSSSISYGDKIIFPISSSPQFIISIIKILFLMGREPFCGAFWFIISLIFINIIYSIINYISNKQPIFQSKKIELILVLFTFSCGCLMNKLGLNIQRFSPSLTLLLPYYIGHLVGQKQLKVSFNNRFFFVLSLSNLFYLSNKGSIAMNTNSFTSVIFLILNMIYGIYVVMFISKKIVKYFPNISKKMQFIGQNTMAIMGWHFVAFKIVTIIQVAFGIINYSDLAFLGAVHSNYNSIWYYLYILVGVIVPVVIHNFVKEKLKIHVY